jgi:hypothetical protein
MNQFLTLRQSDDFPASNLLKENISSDLNYLTKNILNKLNFTPSEEI